MASTLANTIEFLKDFGMFDVVLPFLFVFTIVFAVLEKTYILGKEKDGTPRKNLNSMVAFVMAFLVIAVNKAVNFLSNLLPNIVLLMVVGISFLMLIGVFLKQGELELGGKKQKAMMWIMLIALIFVVLGAYPVGDSSALMYIFDKVDLSDSLVTGIIAVLVIVAIMYYIVKGSSGAQSEGEP
ncbi:MAG: hypothetical protein ABIH25_02630 [Candidatus Woesearchaeota archaeon]